MTDPRSLIPSVDSLLTSDSFAELLAEHPRARVVEATRAVIESTRDAIAGGRAPDTVEDPSFYAQGARQWLAAAAVPSLRGVINATGVVLHTNLGRAPLADAAVAAMNTAAAYTNLEYDLSEGTRGSRYTHCVSLLRELTGAEDAVVVNNAAGALVLALNTLARGSGVAVSRGELVEIGGGFRIPEVLERAGAELVEVGSTNRTRLADYGSALDEAEVGALLKVHRSNFRISGFTEEATVTELAELAGERALPLVYDLGSGLMLPSAELGLPEEPRASEALAQGASVLVISGDKLLGGPQAGLLLGRADLVGEMRRNPLCRALRVDKVTLAGLEATLRLYRDPDRARREIPALRMLSAARDELELRANALADRMAAEGLGVRPVPSTGAVGGGTFPGVELESWAVEVSSEGSPDRLAAALRDGDPPVVGRIADDALLLDVRTLLPGQEETLVSRVRLAIKALEGPS